MIHFRLEGILNARSYTLFLKNTKITKFKMLVTDKESVNTIELKNPDKISTIHLKFTNVRSILADQTHTF